MSDYLEKISVGDRLDRQQEAEGARFTWVENACELVMSFQGPRSAEIRGVEQGVSNPLAEQSSIYSDSLQASLDNVDWLEIAENFISED